ncbi:MAG: hypothetical protein ABJA67_03060 [Chthonomonadales bacterium]
MKCTDLLGPDGQTAGVHDAKRLTERCDDLVTLMRAVTNKVRNDVWAIVTTPDLQAAFRARDE